MINNIFCSDNLQILDNIIITEFLNLQNQTDNKSICNYFNIYLNKRCEFRFLLNQLNMIKNKNILFELLKREDFSSIFFAYLQTKNENFKPEQQYLFHSMPKSKDFFNFCSYDYFFIFFQTLNQIKKEKSFNNWCNFLSKPINMNAFIKVLSQNSHVQFLEQFFKSVYDNNCSEIFFNILTDKYYNKAQEINIKFIELVENKYYCHHMNSIKNIDIFAIFIYEYQDQIIKFFESETEYSNKFLKDFKLLLIRNDFCSALFNNISIANSGPFSKTNLQKLFKLKEITKEDIQNIKQSFKKVRVQNIIKVILCIVAAIILGALCCYGLSKMW